MGFEAMASNRMIDLLIDPPTDDRVAEAELWRQVNSEALRVIRRILAESTPREEIAMEGERVLSLSVAGDAAASAWMIRSNWLTLPAIKAQFVQAARDADLMRTAYGKTKRSAALGEHLADRHLKLLGTPENPATLAGSAVEANIFTGRSGRYDRIVQRFARSRALSRMAATALAIKLYRVDHDDRLPASLDVLVPDYLPFVPGDPFTLDGPIGYRPDAAIPFLYSVYEDGIDDGGSMEPTGETASVYYRGIDRWSTKDLIVPLGPSPRDEVDPWNYLYDGGEALLSQ